MKGSASDIMLDLSCKDTEIEQELRDSANTAIQLQFHPQNGQLRGVEYLAKHRIIERFQVIAMLKKLLTVNLLYLSKYSAVFLNIILYISRM